ncbi:transposable element Tcb2 transposase [Trichonephila clavipes]|nr:transposable element Tcb2 transposase [Trichonephila clavipes]
MESLGHASFPPTALGRRDNEEAISGDPLTENHQHLRLQWDHEHRAWQADWHQVVFSDELRFNFCKTTMATFVLDAMPVIAAFQSALSNDIVV